MINTDWILNGRGVKMDKTKRYVYAINISVIAIGLEGKEIVILYMAS